jgi:putative acetyltransferase
VTLREERPSDIATIYALHYAAFGDRDVEPQVVDDLRDQGVLELSLVATEDDAIVGHIALSTAHVEEVEVLALGPLGVLPDRQRAGIGSALVRAALDWAAATDRPLVALLGHPTYYPRFGFRPASELGIEPPFDVPPEAWMAFALPGHSSNVQGRFRYAPAFPED